jgi:hypothetical protein
MEPVLEIVPRDRGHVALPPAPRINERLIDADQPNYERRGNDQNQKPFAARHASRLDKRLR